MRRRDLPFAVCLALAVALVGMPSLEAQTAATVVIDVAANRQPIDPRIYGVAFASQADLLAMNVPLNRSGRQRHHALQLAGQRQQPRQRLVLREPRRRQPDAGRGHGRVRHPRPAPAAPSRGSPSRRSAGWPSWGPTAACSPASPSRSTARRQGNDAVVGRRRQRRPHQRQRIITATTPTTPTSRQTPTFQQGLVQHLVAHLGHGERTAACATTSSTTSRASGTRRTATSTRSAPTHGRGPRPASSTTPP